MFIFGRQKSARFYSQLRESRKTLPAIKIEIVKKTTLILVLLFAFKSFSQEFEGQIKYDISFKSVDGGKLSNEDLVRKTVGRKSVFVTKKGAYKQITDSNFMALQIYNPDQGKLYYQNDTESDTINYKDVLKWNNENYEYEYEIVKNADTILGYICDKLIQRSKIGEQDFYYNSKLKLNPIHFKNFIAFEKNKVTEIMKSVFLRSDMRFKNLILSYLATEINESKISDETFNLPKGKVIIEN